MNDNGRGARRARVQAAAVATGEGGEEVGRAACDDDAEAVATALRWARRRAHGAGARYVAQLSSGCTVDVTREADEPSAACVDAAFERALAAGCALYPAEHVGAFEIALADDLAGDGVGPWRADFCVDGRAQYTGRGASPSRAVADLERVLAEATAAAERRVHSAALDRMAGELAAVRAELEGLREARRATA